MLAVDDRVDKSIEELFPCSHEQRLDKVDHLEVLFEVVLKRSSSEDDSSRSSDPIDRLVDG